MRITRMLRSGLVIGLGVIAGTAASGLGAEWRHTAELSFIKADGNTEATSIISRTRFIMEWTHTSLDLEAGALMASSDEATTAERYSASEKFSWKWSGRNYLFEKAGWETDRFSGITGRYTGSAGAGRELLKIPSHRLAAEAGAGYVFEERTGDVNNDFASGQAALDYIFDLSETASLSQQASYTANFEEAKDYRIDSATALTASISSRFSLKVSFVWKRVNMPPPGYGREDTITSAALIFNSSSKGKR